MEPRLDYRHVAPEAFRAMAALQRFSHDCGLEPSLQELMKIRASQLNGCGFCLDMHTQDARAEGETEQRIYLLSAWREAPFYSPRERAALAWTEAVTRLADGPVPETLYGELREQFNEKEAVDLTMAIIAINGWNRLAATFRSPTPGSYQPPHK